MRPPHETEPTLAPGGYVAPIERDGHIVYECWLTKFGEHEYLGVASSYRDAQNAVWRASNRYKTPIIEMRAP